MVEKMLIAALLSGSIVLLIGLIGQRIAKCIKKSEKKFKV